MSSLKEARAKKKLQKGVKNNFDAIFKLGLKYFSEGNFNFAINYFTKAIKLKPNCVDIYHNRGVCYLEQKNYKLALNDYNKVIELNPNDVDAYNSRGICYFRLKEYELSLDDYNKSIQLNNNYSKAYVNRGNCYFEQNNYEHALKDYNKSIQLNPDYFEAYNSRGIYYSKQKNYELALKDYDKVIQLNPNYIKAYINRGNCYSEQESHELALNDYNKAIELDPNNAETYNGLGIYYFKQGNYDISLNFYNKSIQLNPKYAIFYNNRGSCYFEQRNYELALNDYNKAIQLDISYANAYFNRGVCYSEQKKYESMLEDFNEAIKINHKLCFLSSNVCISSKKYKEARYYIEKAFENATSEELRHKQVYLSSIDSAEEIDKKNQKLEKINKQLKEKDIEIEDMMSMFAHKFRSPLDAIIYNTSHGKDTKLYTESANTMRGLLDIFSIISADDKILTDKIKNDSKGNATLMSVLNKNLNMTLLHLLSVSGMSKIHQHYMNYAKAQGKITDDVSYKEWCDDYFEMEGKLQKQWEQEFSALLNQSASLAERLQWLEQYFFKLDIIGFEIESIQFKEYETTESFLFILMNEILVNAFKYYASENKKSVVLEWTATENDQILSCRNPSIRRERDQHKGSGKGHTFLSALARKTGCKFTKPKPQDDFLLEFAIPNQLLLSNVGAGK